jgi:hypothetical protein
MPARKKIIKKKTIKSAPKRKSKFSLKRMLAPFLVLVGVAGILSYALLPKTAVLSSQVASAKSMQISSVMVTPLPTTANLSKPDLAVTGGVVVSSKEVGIKTPINVKFTIVNKGAAPTQPYYYSDYQDGYSTMGSGQTCTSVTILNSGDTCVVSFDLTFPTAGTKLISVMLDRERGVAESNESNNFYSAVVNVIKSSVTSTPTPTIKFISPTKSPTSIPTRAPTITPTSNVKLCAATVQYVNTKTACKPFKSGSTTGMNFGCSDGYVGTRSNAACTSAAAWYSIAARECAARKAPCK